MIPKQLYNLVSGIAKSGGILGSKKSLSATFHRQTFRSGDADT